MAPHTAYSLRGNSVGGGALEPAFQASVMSRFSLGLGRVRFALALEALATFLDRSDSQACPEDARGLSAR